MLLTSFDPFTRDFDRIVGRAFGPAWSSFRPGTAAGMPMDAVRTEDGLTLRFDLPGIDPASIEVTVDRGSSPSALSGTRSWPRARSRTCVSG